MKLSRKTLQATAILVAVLGFFAVQRIRSEAKVAALLTEGTAVAGLAPLTREEEVAYHRGKIRLNALGGETAGSSVTAEIVTYLDHSSRDVQFQALRLLGRGQDPAALPALQAKVDEEKWSLQAKIALARVESRGLRGRAKLKVISRKIGLSWSEMLLLSQRAGDFSGYSSGHIILDEMTDVLCSMAQRGEKVDAVVNLVSPPENPSQNRKWRILHWVPSRDFRLDRTQMVRVQAAPLPEAQEIRMLLDYVGDLYGLRGDEYRLMADIVGRGPLVPSQVVAKLDEIGKYPRRYFELKPIPGRPGAFRSEYGLHAIMRLCSTTSDLQVATKLWQMERSELPLAVRYSAREALAAMRLRLYFKGNN